MKYGEVIFNRVNTHWFCISRSGGALCATAFQYALGVWGNKIKIQAFDRHAKDRKEVGITRCRDYSYCGGIKLMIGRRGRCCQFFNAQVVLNRLNIEPEFGTYVWVKATVIRKGGQ